MTQPCDGCAETRAASVSPGLRCFETAHSLHDNHDSRLVNNWLALEASGHLRAGHMTYGFSSNRSSVLEYSVACVYVEVKRGSKPITIVVRTVHILSGTMPMLSICKDAGAFEAPCSTSAANTEQTPEALSPCEPLDQRTWQCTASSSGHRDNRWGDVFR